MSLQIDKINEQIKRIKEEESVELVSDGYHSFEELYHHRMILFLVICQLHPHLSWKSRQHHDGTMYDNNFIVGIETPLGSFTYHYNTKFWEDFKVKELDRAPIFDGHQSRDVVRLLSLL